MGIGERMSVRTHIKANQPWWRVDWYEIWEYRELLWNLVSRDFITVYKQTILGPLWFIFQPLATTLTFTVIFGNLAKIPTDNLPPFLFYMCGTVLWTYFQACMDTVSGSLVTNSGIFGKVYFPRLIPPLAVVVNNLARLAINLGLFLAFWLFFMFFKQAPVEPNIWMIVFPLLVIQCAGLGLGIGLWLSSLTAKYKDISFILPFFAQLWMYATPVVYPASMIPERFNWWIAVNPMASVIEVNRYAFLGQGMIDPVAIASNFIIMLVLLFSGIAQYNRVQRTFIDTI
jgi:lipopolysaccharide transport system permease protein